MGKTKNNLIFSREYSEMRQAAEAALKKVSKKLIEETKKELFDSRSIELV